MGNSRPAKDIDAALRKKGFGCKTKSDHFRYTYFLPDGTKTDIQTKISHGMGNTSLSADLISKMARQLHLTKKQFLNFIDCTLSEEMYREILKEQEIGI